MATAFSPWAHTVDRTQGLFGVSFIGTLILSWGSHPHDPI